MYVTVRWSKYRCKTVRKYINSHALPLVNSEKEHVSETRCQRHDCSLKNKHTVGSSALLVCHAHTHTHKNTFNDQLGPNMSPTRHWKRTVLCKETQQIYGKYCLLKALPNTLSTGWYNNGLALEVTKKRILEAWLFTRQTSTDEENSKEDWAVVLESWNGSREVSDAIPGNSQLGLHWHALPSVTFSLF